MRLPAAIHLLFATFPMGTAAAQATGPWFQYETPADAGFSASRLEAARTLADSLGSGAVMAVYRGHVLAAWGDVAREFQLHSVRKSLVSALYGPAVAERRIDPEWTLATLGVDDLAGLTDVERKARIRDLLASRSGIYLPATYAPDAQDEERPPRGSHQPGTRWFYNNWDFNVAGALYERLSGESLFEAFARRIARPLGMEDYAPEDGYLVYEPTASRHPAHTFRMSTRDLARFGQLILQEGRWNGKEIIPADWVRESLSLHSEFDDGAGYGWMWWIHPAGSGPDRYPTLKGLDFAMARGTGGQALFVIPGAEMVIVHRGDTDHGRGISGPRVWEIAERILAARTGEPSPGARLAPMAPTPFESQLPAPPPERFLPVSEADLSAVTGSYRMENGSVIRVYSFQGRPYGHVPGEGDAELFRVGEDEWTIRVVPGVRLRFQRDDDRRIIGLTMSLGRRTIVARRVGEA